MTNPVTPKRGFMFWALSPFLLIFVVLMPLLIQKRDAAAISILVGLEVTGILMLIGLYDPYRFYWAWRGVGAMVFVAYVCYIAGMLIERKWQVPRGRGEANLFNAIAGLVAFGLPGLWWALFGRFPRVFESLDQRHADEDEFDEDDIGDSR